MNERTAFSNLTPYHQLHSSISQDSPDGRENRALISALFYKEIQLHHVNAVSTVFADAQQQLLLVVLCGSWVAFVQRCIIQENYSLNNTAFNRYYSNSYKLSSKIHTKNHH